MRPAKARRTEAEPPEDAMLDEFQDLAAATPFASMQPMASWYASVIAFRIPVPASCTSIALARTQSRGPAPR